MRDNRSCNGKCSEVTRRHGGEEKERNERLKSRIGEKEKKGASLGAGMNAAAAAARSAYSAARFRGRDFYARESERTEISLGSASPSLSSPRSLR